MSEGDFHLRTRVAVHALKRHLDLKRSVSRDARVVAIKLLYSAITDAEGLDQMLQRGFAKVLCRLLKKREKQPLDLRLKWRPLFHLMDRLLFGKARTPQTPLCRNLPYYTVLLARNARNYFEEGANHEILTELRPCCCPQDMSLLRAQAFMCLLLVRQAPDAADCVDEIFAMWSWIVSYTDWDLYWMQLLASLCRHTYRERHEMWDRYIPTIFSHVLHCLDLPVGPSGIHMYDSKESSIGHSDGYPLGSLSVLVHKGSARTKSLQLVNKAAKMIVYLLRPRAARNPAHPATSAPAASDGGGDIGEDDASAMSHLARLAKAIESFLHPSNGGYWTRRLTQLLSSLCHHLQDRVQREKLSNPGPAIKLQQSDITEFVHIVMPLALQGLYSKNSAGMSQVTERARKMERERGRERECVCMCMCEYCDMDDMNTGVFSVEGHGMPRLQHVAAAAARPCVWGANHLDGSASGFISLGGTCSHHLSCYSTSKLPRRRHASTQHYESDTEWYRHERFAQDLVDAALLRHSSLRPAPDSH